MEGLVEGGWVMEILNIAYGVFMVGVFSLVIYELIRKRDHGIVNAPKIKIYTTSKKAVFVQEDSETSVSEASASDQNPDENCECENNECECENNECECECENNECEVVENEESDPCDVEE